MSAQFPGRLLWQWRIWFALAPNALMLAGIVAAVFA